MSKPKPPSPEKLRAILKQRGWTQVEAVRRLGISPDAMKRYCVPVGSKSHGKIPNTTWELLLLFAGMHKDWILVPRQALLAEHLEAPYK